MSETEKETREDMEKWCRLCSKAFKTFDDSNVGIQAPYKLPVDAKEVEYFKLYFDGELLGDIKSETNRYADQLLANPTAQTKTLRDWIETTVDEFHAFFALMILMGIVVNKSMKDYWSERAATKTPFFLKFLVIKGFSKSYVHFTLLITQVCHQDLAVIDYGKLGRLLIFLLIDFLVFLCR